jgi:hypothetical protein
MQATFANRSPERKMGAAFTVAIHIALLAALLTFRPDLAEPVEPERSLAVDLVPAPPPEAPILEPVPVEQAPSTASRQSAAAAEAGAPAPETARQEIDRTAAVAPAASFPAGPAPSAEPGSAGTAGTGLAGDGAGSGPGPGGSGTGAGTRARAAFDPPSWIAKPTFSQMALHNPRRAARERVSGTALLACRVDLPSARPQLPDPPRIPAWLRLRQRRSGRRPPRPDQPRHARRSPRPQSLGRNTGDLPELRRPPPGLRQLRGLTAALSELLRRLSGVKQALSRTRRELPRYLKQAMILTTLLSLAGALARDAITSRSPVKISRPKRRTGRPLRRVSRWDRGGAPLGNEPRSLPAKLDGFPVSSSL